MYAAFAVIFMCLVFQEVSSILSKLCITSFEIPRPVMTRYDSFTHAISYGKCAAIWGADFVTM